MAQKVQACKIKKEKGHLYFVDKAGNVAKIKRGESEQKIVWKNEGEFKREDGWIYFVDKQGDISRAKMKSFREYAIVKDEAEDQLYIERNWIQTAFNDVKARGTEGVCTGNKFGSASCPAGSKRYNMAKNLRNINKHKN